MNASGGCLGPEQEPSQGWSQQLSAVKLSCSLASFMLPFSPGKNQDQLQHWS